VTEFTVVLNLLLFQIPVLAIGVECDGILAGFAGFGVKIVAILFVTAMFHIVSRHFHCQ
jgi:hypothetical protein